MVNLPIVCDIEKRFEIGLFFMHILKVKRVII